MPVAFVVIGFVTTIASMIITLFVGAFIATLIAILAAIIYYEHWGDNGARKDNADM